jgi:hypothetical protein
MFWQRDKTSPAEILERIRTADGEEPLVAQGASSLIDSPDSDVAEQAAKGDRVPSVKPLWNERKPFGSGGRVEAAIPGGEQ